MKKKMGLTVGLSMIVIGALGFLLLGIFFFSGYGSFVASPDSGWLQTNTSWMGSGGMMGNGRGMNADLARNMMRPIACANCHGINGQGGFVFPDGKTVSADIRWETLTDEGFDTAKFKKTVTEGLDEKDERLSVWVPRWDITDKDLDELIVYLKTL